MKTWKGIEYFFMNEKKMCFVYVMAKKVNCKERKLFKFLNGVVLSSVFRSNSLLTLNQRV